MRSEKFAFESFSVSPSKLFVGWLSKIKIIFFSGLKAVIADIRCVNFQIRLKPKNSTELKPKRKPVLSNTKTLKMMLQRVASSAQYKTLFPKLS